MSELLCQVILDRAGSVGNTGPAGWLALAANGGAEGRANLVYVDRV